MREEHYRQRKQQCEDRVIFKSAQFVATTNNSGLLGKKVQETMEEEPGTINRVGLPRVF